MLEIFNDVLGSILFRALELEPSIRIDDAAARILQVVRASVLEGLSEAQLKKDLQDLGARYCRHGVINPTILASRGLRPHFFLVDAGVGWLEQLVAASAEKRQGISQYIIYGGSDALIALYGSDEEASKIQLAIERSVYYNQTYFSTRSVPLLYRYATDVDCAPGLPNPDEVDRIAIDYDNPNYQVRRDELLQQGVFLGPVWLPTDFVRDRIVAWVGINLKSDHEVKPAEVLHALLRDITLRTTLVHLFETNGGPFHYFAKLVCQNLHELDQATNAIGYTHIGRARMEGATLVAANGSDHVPLFRTNDIAGIASSLDLGELEQVAHRMIGRLGTDAVVAFNGLNSTYKLVVLRCLDELNEQVERRAWDDERDRSIQSAIATFSRQILDPSRATMTGAVIDITTAVESLTKHVVRRIAEGKYGKKYTLIQRVLRMPTKDFRKLSLGKATEVLRTISTLNEFSEVDLDVEWLDRLDEFYHQRNKWAHSGPPPGLREERKIDDARGVLVEGIELIRWLSGIVIPISAAPIEISLPEKMEERGFGIFISHSTLDKDVAEKIAVGLKALNYPIWYSDWSIAPSESIVEKIEEGLAKNDTLIILVSPNSIDSDWVKRELNSALMAQLQGQRITVLPVLIAPCPLPALLSDIKYIDMSKDFQDGFIELLKFLGRRRNGGLSSRQEGPKT